MKECFSFVSDFHVKKMFVNVIFIWFPLIEKVNNVLCHLVFFYVLQFVTHLIAFYGAQLLLYFIVNEHFESKAASKYHIPENTIRRYLFFFQFCFYPFWDFFLIHLSFVYLKNGRWTPASSASPFFTPSYFNFKLPQQRFTTITKHEETRQPDITLPRRTFFYIYFIFIIY